MSKKPKLSSNLVKRSPNKSRPLRKIKSHLLDKIGSLSEVEREKVKQQVNLMMNRKKDGKSNDIPDDWRGLFATPPGSFLDAVLKAFYNGTDIPLEIPFFTAMSYVSSHLLKEGVVYEYDGVKHTPEIWTVILAASGAGKTFSTKFFERSIETKPDFPDAASAAKFVENLKLHPHGFWLRDEFGQFLKAINDQPQLAELKDYLLRVYDNSTVHRNTKNSEITVENPALVIQGITVYDTFLDQMSVDSLIDGFAQRFSYVIAESDPNRKLTDFPLYQMKPFVEMIKKEWVKLTDSIQHKTYTLSDEAIEAFKVGFAGEHNEDIPASFYRRIMFKVFKYALIYHFLLGKTSSVIDLVDITWAMRLSRLHLKDALKLLKGHDQSDLQKLIDQADEVVKRLREKEMPVTPRNLIRNMRQISNTNEARALLSFLDIKF